MMLTIKPNNIKIDVEEGTLLSHALRKYAKIEMVCGGRGICGKCKVLATGDLSPLTEKEKDLEENYRLACTTKILGDATVFVPEKRVSTQILIENQIRPTPIKNGFQSGFGIGFDIGSTTLAAYLVSLSDGKVISVASSMNPQIFYGEDLISRIDYINTHQEGLATLQKSVVGALNDLVQNLCEENSISQRDIKKATFVGNTCMNHITLGINPKSLGEAPYEPVLFNSVIKKPEDIGINIDGDLYFFPNIAGFVGGDTVGVILSAMKEDSGETLLAVDIGTNGEMALRHKGHLYVCSAAAGPAFEGGGISCDMRGATGAVDSAYVEKGEIKVHVIGEGEPLGICGSGLVDLVKVLAEEEIIDETGRMEEDFLISEKVALTPKDVRSLQLAKGSIAAAIKTLLSLADVKEESLDRIYLAGGFGNYLNKASAVKIGLLPNIDLDKIIPIGNGAGSGAVLALINEDEWEETEKIRALAEHVELAHSPDYQMNLMESMMF